MYLYYKEGFPLKIESEVKNFSYCGYTKVEFNPVDLFIELATDYNSNEREKYIIDFINKLGKDRHEVIDLIKSELDYWITKDYEFLDESLARIGALSVKKVFDKYRI